MKAEEPDYEMDDLERMLDGTFDNYEQVYWEMQRGVEPALRHRRTTSVYRRVHLPRFEGRVFYAHKWWDGDPAVVAYRNLYVIRRDPALGLPRLDLLTIPDPRRLDHALEDGSVLHTLTPEEMTRMAPECNTVWRREGDAFRVAMAGDCRLSSVSPTGEPLAITVDTKVDEHNFLYLSYGRDSTGALQYGPRDLVHSRELRARWFDGWIRYGGAERRVRLHDQGGFCAVDGPDGPLRVRLRQVRWPTHERAPALAVVAMRGRQRELLIDPPRDVAPDVAYAAPDAGAIGLATPDFEITFANAHRDYRGSGA